jgi:uncharacterized protein (DUF2345 family)
MIFVRQPAAVAERRRAERTIKAVAPMRTTRAMTIHSHIGGELDSLADAVALGSVAGAAELAGADEVTAGTAGLELTAAEELVLSAGEELVLSAGEELVLSAGEELAGWLAVRLAIALLMLLLMLELHAVAMPAAHKSVAARSRFPVSRRIDGPFPHL